jgi:hypothetical protein
MDKTEVTYIVHEQITQGGKFENYHGITSDNISKYLVEPYEVLVDINNFESLPCLMWVILHECPGQSNIGLVIVYDPSDKSFNTAEKNIVKNIWTRKSFGGSLINTLKIM